MSFNAGHLDLYLKKNNCLTTTKLTTCYKNTRLLLIVTTKELDERNARINGLNQIIDKLIDNINVIIDNLGESEKSSLKETITNKVSR